MKNFGRFFLLALALTSAACGTTRKIRQIKDGGMQASLSLPSSGRVNSPLTLPPPNEGHDTLQVVDFEGRRTLLMNAVRDENGEMVASDRLEAAVVSARFRNVAERNGKVELQFQVRVPESMQERRWQLRLSPDMFLLGDSLRLGQVTITGRDYRKAQLRGYEQYRRFLNSIVTDSTLLINMHDLEIFISRNLPEVYAFRNDSSYVSDEQFASVYGVTERMAVEHYTIGMLKRRNERRMARRDIMYRRLVKSPILTEGIRLDTVMRDVNGDFIYNYVQSVNTRPGLRKIDIKLSGSIWEQDRCIYSIPASQPLTFYISSMSTLADNSERYLRRIVERKVEENTACYIEFPLGQASIYPGLGHNASEMGRIKGNIRSLLVNDDFELDSISIVAFASPEGPLKANEQLCAKRAASASAYFSSFVKELKDSLERHEGMFIAVGDGTPQKDRRPIAFSSRSGGENWHMLDALVREDMQLAKESKENYSLIAGTPDPDEREYRLSRSSDYRYFREHLYPRLRVVKFSFYLHRKGMLKDTLHTTELDTVYMRGLQQIRDRDYEAALKSLRPYSDFNTALVYLALGRNASAMNILEGLGCDARVEYLLAIAHSREGNEGAAIEHYMRACELEPAFVHRGNLDPEISELIGKYRVRIDNS